MQVPNAGNEGGDGKRTLQTDIPSPGVRTAPHNNIGTRKRGTITLQIPAGALMRSVSDRGGFAVISRTIVHSSGSDPAPL